MPRRNLFVLITVSVVSLICYQQVATNRYGRIVADAINQVEHRYLEQIEPTDLFEGAMQGMIDRLDDPYSAFISPKDLQEFHEIIDQKFGGVGMEVALDPKTRQLTVLSPLVGTPAYKAGICAGDRILRIDDHSTQGMSLRDAVAHMRGKSGQPVTLSILHQGDSEPVDITIVRAVIQIDTVLGDTRNADGSWNFFLDGYGAEEDSEESLRIGYLRINVFSENTAKELREAIDGLLAHGMDGLILDMRNNPGGLLGAATDVCDMFIDSGVIVTTRGRDKQVKRTVRATAPGTHRDFPIAVLVNQYSASASEIVAACLQDHSRAVIIGQRTWGKGTVQEVINLEAAQGAVKLTTASYWRPNEKNIHRGKDVGEQADWGVTPDDGCEVIVEGDELTKLRLWRMHRDRPGVTPGDDADAEPYTDPQLEKAIEYIEGKLTIKPRPVVAAL